MPKTEPQKRGRGAFFFIVGYFFWKKGFEFLQGLDFIGTGLFGGQYICVRHNVE